MKFWHHFFYWTNETCSISRLFFSPRRRKIFANDPITNSYIITCESKKEQPFFIEVKKPYDFTWITFVADLTILKDNFTSS